MKKYYNITSGRFIDNAVVKRTKKIITATTKLDYGNNKLSQTSCYLIVGKIGHIITVREYDIKSELEALKGAKQNGNTK